MVVVPNGKYHLALFAAAHSRWVYRHLRQHEPGPDILPCTYTVPQPGDFPKQRAIECIVLAINVHRQVSLRTIQPQPDKHLSAVHSGRWHIHLYLRLLGSHRLPAKHHTGLYLPFVLYMGPCLLVRPTYVSSIWASFSIMPGVMVLALHRLAPSQPHRRRTLWGVLSRQRRLPSGHVRCWYSSRVNYHNSRISLLSLNIRSDYSLLGSQAVRLIL